MRSLILLPIVVTVVISGCSSWPEEGQGGWAEYSVNHGHETAAFNNDNNVLFSEFDHLNIKLDALQAQGIEQCMPGQIIKVKLFQNRIKRALTAELWQQAEQDLVEHYHALNQLEQHFTILKERTNCALIASQAEEDSLLDVISILLNSDNQFADDDAQISPKFQVNIAKAADLLKQIRTRDILLIGHADVRGDNGYNFELALKRADAVKHWLILYGFDSNRIVTLSKGKSEKSDTSAPAMLSQRRVDAVFINSDSVNQLKLFLKNWSKVLQKMGNKEMK
jgi:outer membrane protein OmpA-like peptidoglycan-associated protein